MATTPTNTTGQAYNQDAFAYLNALFDSYGLGTLAPAIVNYLKQGYSTDTVALMLQETPEYKQRFAANEARRKAGLAVLSPSEYLATESAYRQIMQAAGVPSGFYDQPADFQKFLEQDISPTELQSRVSDAETFIQRADPNEMAFFKQYYTKGDMIAYALDPTRAEPLIGKSFNAAAIGGQAAAQGFNVSQQQAEALAGLGVTSAQASQGFGAIAGEMPNANKLAEISGQKDFTTQDLIDETFANNAAVAQKRQKLASQERARFGGSGAVVQGSLSTNDGGQY